MRRGLLLKPQQVLLALAALQGLGNGFIIRPPSRGHTQGATKPIGLGEGRDPLVVDWARVAGPRPWEIGESSSRGREQRMAMSTAHLSDEAEQIQLSVIRCQSLLRDSSTFK
jgi:hypothetical protein